MARLPKPGGDTGTWGDILNDFLKQEHNSDGTLKNVVRLADSRLTDSRTPIAHKDSHKTGGSDALAPADIGLGNVDNTSDPNKPVSTAQAAGLRTIDPSAQIDLCGSTYGATPGHDITTALQTALNWIATNCTHGGEVYFSKVGTYLINGAPQTGTAQGYTYNGQVLIPAVSCAGSMPITIRGSFRSSSGGSGTGSPKGVILQSNATSGYMFDIIPAYTQVGCPWTGVMPIFEDLVICVPNNPTCGGLNLLCTQRARISRVAFTIPTQWTVPAAGSLEALVLPQVYNNGDVSVRDVDIRGYPVAIRLSEHNVLDNIYIEGCRIAFMGGGISYKNWFGHVGAFECPTIFDGGIAPAFGTPTLLAGSAVVGTLEYENLNTAALKPVAFVNDTPTNRIRGQLNLWRASSGTYPVVGGSLLDLIPANPTPSFAPELKLGWQETHPYDNFNRRIALSGAGAPGQCSPTLHPWRVEAGSFSVTGGDVAVLTGLTGADKCFVPVLQAGSTDGQQWSGFSLSRVITMRFTLGSGSPLIYILASSPVIPGGTASGGGLYGLMVRIAAGDPLWLRANNTTITAGGPTLVAGSTHTVRLAVLHDSTGYPYRAKVYLDGAVVIDSMIPTASKGLSHSNPYTYPYYEDGIYLADTTSTISRFIVNAIDPEPAPNLNKAIAYSASMTPDATQGIFQTIRVTNTSAMTINAPSNPPVATQTQDLTIEVLNVSGAAMGVITWDSAFKFAGATWTNPANGYQRAAYFRWNGTKWICTGVSAADY